MLPSHETCPICQKTMIHSKKINKACPLIGEVKLSYVESICSRLHKLENLYPEHVYFQISSPQQELMYHKICLIQKKMDIGINYLQPSTTAQIYCRSNLKDQIKMETILLPRTLQVDFNNLTELFKQIERLIPFI